MNINDILNDPFFYAADPVILNEKESHDFAMRLKFFRNRKI